MILVVGGLIYIQIQFLFQFLFNF